MKVFGIICAVAIAIIAFVWLYRKIVIAGKYTRTVGEIINFKNMLPLVNKTMENHKDRYLYTECKYQGDAFVVVRFTAPDGQEMTRRFNVSEPLTLKINEHERTVPQFTGIHPEWQIGRKEKVYYNPADTTDIFVGKAPSYHQVIKPNDSSPS